MGCSVILFLSPSFPPFLHRYLVPDLALSAPKTTDTVLCSANTSLQEIPPHGDAVALHSRAHTDTLCKRFFPQGHPLAFSISQRNVCGLWSRCHWELMPDPLCLFLQPLSTGDASSSASTASNRSRNRTRYRTKAMNSEVDESLFGGVKVTNHLQTPPARSCPPWVATPGQQWPRPALLRMKLVLVTSLRLHTKEKGEVPRP